MIDKYKSCGQNLVSFLCSNVGLLRALPRYFRGHSLHFCGRCPTIIYFCSASAVRCPTTSSHCGSLDSVSAPAPLLFCSCLPPFIASCQTLCCPPPHINNYLVPNANKAPQQLQPTGLQGLGIALFASAGLPRSFRAISAKIRFDFMVFGKLTSNGGCRTYFSGSAALTRQVFISTKRFCFKCKKIPHPQLYLVKSFRFWINIMINLGEMLGNIDLIYIFKYGTNLKIIYL